jgi:hypothetical protein
VRKVHAGLHSFLSMRRIEAQEGKCLAVEIFPVLGQPAAPIEPRDCRSRSPSLNPFRPSDADRPALQPLNACATAPSLAERVEVDAVAAHGVTQIPKPHPFIWRMDLVAWHAPGKEDRIHPKLTLEHSGDRQGSAYPNH